MNAVIRDYQRAALISVALAAIGLVAFGVSGHVGVGMLLCVGFGLGVTNTALLHFSALRRAGATDQRSYVIGAAARLAVVTGIAVALAVVFWPDGLAVIVGLVLFQLVLFLVTALRPTERPA